MSPSPLIPKGQPPWLPHGNRSNKSARAEAGLTEEQLADYHARRLYRLTFGQTVASVAVLTIAAAVVILPFFYMLVISLKGPAELGNGRFLPAELDNFQSGKTVWIELKLSKNRMAKLYEQNTLPVMPLKAGTWQRSNAGRLPSGTVLARRLAIEQKPNKPRESTLLLEAPDPDGKLLAGDSLLVYLPVKDMQWAAEEGKVRSRTALSVAGRLLENYQRLLNWDTMKSGHWYSWLKGGYPRWYFNSLFVAFSTVLLGVFLDSLAAFGFAKFNFPFKRALFAILIATLMIPYPVTLVPTFFLFAKLGFYNTYAALIIPGVVSAFGIFLVRQYIETIPDDMLDAARVDGAGDFQVYWKVVLPTARPVLAALAVFRFIFQWNSYLYPLVLTNKDSMKTVQLGIATMEDIHGTVDYGLQMAGSAMAVIPILVVYMFMQKHFIAGITMGSSKA